MMRDNNVYEDTSPEFKARQTAIGVCVARRPLWRNVQLPVVLPVVHWVGPCGSSSIHCIGCSSRGRLRQTAIDVLLPLMGLRQPGFARQRSCCMWGCWLVSVSRGLPCRASWCAARPCTAQPLPAPHPPQGRLERRTWMR